jgi:hypothetical protein
VKCLKVKFTIVNLTSNGFKSKNQAILQVKIMPDLQQNIRTRVLKKLSNKFATFLQLGNKRK